jgi:hypothetical protein
MGFKKTAMQMRETLMQGKNRPIAYVKEQMVCEVFNSCGDVSPYIHHFFGLGFGQGDTVFHIKMS